MANNHTTRNWLLFIATIVVVFILGLLASNILDRKAEARFAYAPQVKIQDGDPRNHVWGENFPRQYQSYLRTADTSFVSYQGGGNLRDMLEEDPRLVDKVQRKPP